MSLIDSLELRVGDLADCRSVMKKKITWYMYGVGPTKRYYSGMTG